MKSIVFLALFCSGAFAQTPMHEKIVLTTKNAVVLRGIVDSGSVQKAQYELVAAAIKRGTDKTPIYLVVDSPGGSIEDGLSFIEFAKTIPNVQTISIFSASMASAIVEALPGARLITGNGYLMFHRARGGFQGQFEDGEVETRLFMAKRLVRAMEQTNANRMRMKLEDYKSLAKDELWLDSEQALLFRAADKQVDIYCTTELIGETEVIHIDMFLVSADLVFSRCPLFRSPKDDAKNIYQVPTMSSFSNILRRLNIGGGL